MVRSSTTALPPSLWRAVPLGAPTRAPPGSSGPRSPRSPGSAPDREQGGEEAGGVHPALERMGTRRGLDPEQLQRLHEAAMVLQVKYRTATSLASSGWRVGTNV